MFLYERLENWREVIETEVPKYIPKNLNASFKLREYQIKAFENFIMYFENKKSPRPLQVLFHMATGSGKTLIMAGLILYLYKQGYRNFLFFVNLTNIIDKTRENFLNEKSKKYLFAEEIVIDGEKIPINVVENFQSTDDGAINICFETTQGLHSDMFWHKENKMTDEDFKNMKVVLISDEAHHLNVDTKKGSTAEKENHLTWESTIRKIFESNAENILLEFTATCDINNAEIKNFYADKIILSQYRLKIFQEHRLNIKPIILFKSATINDSKNFMLEFLAAIKNLDGNKLEKFLSKCTLPIMERVKKYFECKGIDYEMLAAELRDDFSEQHCISVNDDKDAQANQILLNSLENVDNPYRAIFEVKKLDEGWDVLNLFDIVRLYETRQSGKKISATTISEAQLIGRGARYCPFQIDDEQPKFQRKYDSDIDCELRICETLYYHCQDDSRYISELKDALKEIGLDLSSKNTFEYKLKEEFKRSEFFNTGKIFLNRRIEKNLPPTNEISATIRDKVYSVRIDAGSSSQSNLMTDSAEIESKITAEKFFRYTIKEIAKKNYSIVHKALRKFPIFKFNNLKKIFPKLKSTKNFITDENFLGEIKIEIASDKVELSYRDLYFSVCEVLKKISAEISMPQQEFTGTKDFYPEDISKIFTDKKVNYSSTIEGGRGESQKFDAEFKIDLTKANWFAYEDNCGTSEEKAFVKYFSKHYDELSKHYDKIFLVRNERQFHIYSFDEGKRFEPDYVLFLQKNSETWQIFIEMKGEHLTDYDSWKEIFLLALKDNSKIFYEDKNYKIIGFHFYNYADENIFDKDFKTLISD